jgi:hypothetical protein
LEPLETSFLESDPHKKDAALPYCLIVFILSKKQVPWNLSFITFKQKLLRIFKDENYNLRYPKARNQNVAKH